MCRPSCLGTLSIACLIAFAVDPLAAQAPLPIERIKLPPGFAIEVLARVPNARAMTWGSEGTLFVGSSSGLVHAVTLSRRRRAGRARDRAGIARTGRRRVP